MALQSFRMAVRLRLPDRVIEISTVEEAVNFLEEWPERRRGPVHRCALRACRACMNGTMGTEEARSAFASFVRITGLAPATYSTRPPLPAPASRVGRLAPH